MTKGNLKKQMEERSRAYYSLRSGVYSIRREMQDLKKHRGHSPAFKLLIIALDMFDDQVSRDYDRYERRIKAIERKDVITELQQSLNRERAKRQQLEVKIQEATTSSGLFIKYVREKLSFSKEQSND